LHHVVEDSNSPLRERFGVWLVGWLVGLGQ
jgi:hypothetical protein